MLKPIFYFSNREFEKKNYSAKRVSNLHQSVVQL